MIEVFGAHRMRMQLEARQVGHPHQRGGVARHHFLRRAAGRKRQLDHFDPRRPRVGCPLLVERLLGDPVREPEQHVRPAARAAQRALRHGDVVEGQIQLGVARLREQDLSRVRYGDLAAADGQDLVLGRACHNVLIVDAAAGPLSAPGTDMARPTRTAQLVLAAALAGVLTSGCGHEIRRRARPRPSARRRSRASPPAR